MSPLHGGGQEVAAESLIESTFTGREVNQKPMVLNSRPDLENKYRLYVALFLVNRLLIQRTLTVKLLLPPMFAKTRENVADMWVTVVNS